MQGRRSNRLGNSQAKEPIHRLTLWRETNGFAEGIIISGKRDRGGAKLGRPPRGVSIEFFTGA